MSNDTETIFFALLRSIGALFSGIFYALGGGLSLLGLKADEVRREKEEHTARQKLTAHLDTTELYESNAHLTRAAGFPDLPGFMEAFYQQLAVAADQQNLPEPIQSIRAAIVTTAGLLYSHEGLTTALPQFSGSDPIEEARYRDRLLARIKKTSNPETLSLIFRTLIECTAEYLKALPALAHDLSDGDESIDPSGPTIPLTDVMPNLGAAVYNLIVQFYQADIVELGLFSELRAQLEANQAEASKKSKKEVDPETYGGGDDVVHTFLQGTLLEELFKVSVPLVIPQETRFSGHWIIAPPGRGKTTLLHAMFLDDLPRNASIIVMDSKGDLINPIKNMAEIADRLVLIEPDSQHPLALNPLDVPSESVPHTIALIEYILSGLLEAKFTNLQSALFRHVLPAMLQAFDHPTIETLKRVLADGLTKEETARLDNRLRAFFEDKVHGFYAKTYAETRSQIIWRLDFILTNDTMRAMFASPTTRLKLGEAMNSGKIILIDASKAKLGDDGSEFYQRFFLALILGAAQARSTLKPSQKLPVYCYLDECQWVRNDQKLATILDECRSQKIALILAHQRTDQITNPNVLSAMANCAIRFANSDDEAKYLAPKLRCEPEFLHNLPRGTFAAFVRDLTPHAIALNVPYRDIAELPRMTVGQQAAIRRRMSDEYGFVPALAPISTEVSASPVPEVPAGAAGSPAKTASDRPRSAPARRDEPPPASDEPETGSTW